MTTKTHSSRRNTTVAIGQATQEIYGQCGVLRTPTVSGSPQDVHMERNHLVICRDSFLDLFQPGFVSSPERYWIRRERIPCSYSPCPSLRIVETRASIGPNIGRFIYLRCRKELDPGLQTRGRWMGTLGQGQSYPTRRSSPSPTDNVSLTGNLTSETLHRASDLVDLGKTDNTLEPDTDYHERFHVWSGVPSK